MSYVNNYEKKTLDFTNFSTLYATLARRYKPNWGHCRIQIYVPLEFWVFVFINFATARYVSNSWALVTIVFLEIFLMNIALTRSFIGHYKEIFEFGFELKALRLVKLLSSHVMSEILKAKCKLLFKYVSVLSIIYSIVFIVQFTLLKGRLDAWYWLLMLSLLISLFAVIWALRPVYDAFCAVITMNGLLMLDFCKIELSDISASDVFSKITQSLSRFSLFVVFFTMTLGASFGFVHGKVWEAVCIVAMLALIFSLMFGCVGTFLNILICLQNFV